MMPRTILMIAYVNDLWYIIHLNSIYRTHILLIMYNDITILFTVLPSMKFPILIHHQNYKPSISVFNIHWGSFRNQKKNKNSVTLKASYKLRTLTWFWWSRNMWISWLVLYVASHSLTHSLSITTSTKI